MKALKIYGVKGLMEWQCVITSGGTRFHFTFSEGTMTGYGITPAKYSTSNALLQNVIESSNYFKSGKIFLIKQIVLEEDVAPVEATTGEFKKIEVTCLEDAKEYLAENCGISRLKLKSKQSIENYATENKIEFVGI